MDNLNNSIPPLANHHHLQQFQTVDRATRLQIVVADHHQTGQIDHPRTEEIRVLCNKDNTCDG